MDYDYIDSSLQYGKVISKRQFKIIKICLGVLFLGPLISVCVLITCFCGIMPMDNDIKLTIILLNVEFCFFIIIIIYIIYYYKKLYKNISLWLNDAVKTKAFVRRMDEISLNYKPFQVEFSFEIEGKEYKRLSTHGGLIVGLNKRYIKYHNKTVNILYSPKYDQVMMLKNN